MFKVKRTIQKKKKNKKKRNSWQEQLLPTKRICAVETQLIKLALSQCIIKQCTASGSYYFT